MRGGDLGLVAAVLHRHRERRPQPGRGAHPGRHLGDLLGERLPRIKEPRAALIQARRTGPTSDCPVKIGEPHYYQHVPQPRLPTPFNMIVMRIHHFRTSGPIVLAPPKTSRTFT